MDIYEGPVVVMTLEERDRLKEVASQTDDAHDEVEQLKDRIEQLKRKMARAAHMMAQEKGKTAYDVYELLTEEDDV